MRLSHAALSFCTCVAWLASNNLAPAAVLEEGSVTISPTLITVGISPFDGTLRVTPPSVLSSQRMLIASTTPRAVGGRVFVEGAAISLTGEALIGAAGIGLLEITDGGIVDASNFVVGGSSQPSQPPSEGKLVVDGAGSKIRLSNTLTIGESGIGELVLSDGAVAAPQSPVPTEIKPPAIIGNRTGSVGTATIDGEGTSWLHSGPIHVGAMGTGTMHISGGAHVTSGAAVLGVSGEISQIGLGTAVIDGLGSRWAASSLIIGDRGSGELRIENGGLLDVSAQQSAQQTILGRQLGSFGRLILTGPDARWVESGSSSAPRQVIVGDMGSGELWIEGGAIVTNAGAIIGRGPAGDGLAVIRGEHTRWNAANITVGQTSISSLGRGRLEIADGATLALTATGTAMTINAAGKVVLDDGTIAGTFQQTFRNSGILEGDGSVNVGFFTNSENALVLVEEDDELNFGGTLTNGATASIEIIGGELVVERTLRNQVRGSIIGDHATIRARGGDQFINDGSLSLIGGVNRVFGDVRNNGGIVVTANSHASFFHDVFNNGSLRASEGSMVTVLGAFSGNGVTGGGDVFLEGRVSPGSSPGLMQFDGNVTLGDLSSLVIEIGGTAPGTEFDQLDVADTIHLGGDLVVEALAAIEAPATLKIVSAGQVEGTFGSVPEIGSDVGFGVRFNGVTYDYQHDDVLLSLLPPLLRLEGDFDADADVDGGDFLAWQRQSFAEVPAWEGADANGDGLVNGADLSMWAAHLPAAEEPTPEAGAVPEPHSVVLIGLGLVAVGLRRIVVRRNGV